MRYNSLPFSSIIIEISAADNFLNIFYLLPSKTAFKFAKLGLILLGNNEFLNMIKLEFRKEQNQEYLFQT